MTQCVRPEVSRLDIKCLQSSAHDVVDGRGEDGGSGRRYSDEDLGVRHLGSDVVDVSPESLPHGRHERVNLGLTTFEAPDMQQPANLIDLIESKGCHLSSAKTVNAQQKQDRAVSDIVLSIAAGGGNHAPHIVPAQSVR